MVSFYGALSASTSCQKPKGLSKALELQQELSHQGDAVASLSLPSHPRESVAVEARESSDTTSGNLDAFLLGSNF